jgi:tetratricopeptide (TPR) repeat protein
MMALRSSLAVLVVSLLLFTDQSQAAKVQQPGTAVDAAVALEQLEADDDTAVQLCSLGIYPQAETLFRRIIAMKEKMLGSEHPDLAATLGELAWCYFQQRRHTESVALFNRVLAIEEKALCKDHIGLANTLDSLAAVHVEEGSYAEAEGFYRRALTIREKMLGQHHPEVATSLNSLAILLYAQGRSLEAIPLSQRALAILKERFPVTHPKVELYQQNYDEIKRRVHEQTAR